jgi:hypothetical protein
MAAPAAPCSAPTTRARALRLPLAALLALAAAAAADPDFRLAVNRVIQQRYEPLLHDGDRVRIYGTQLELI